MFDPYALEHAHTQNLGDKSSYPDSGYVLQFPLHRQAPQHKNLFQGAISAPAVAYESEDYFSWLPVASHEDESSDSHRTHAEFRDAKSSRRHLGNTTRPLSNLAQSYTDDDEDDEEDDEDDAGTPMPVGSLFTRIGPEYSNEHTPLEGRSATPKSKRGRNPGFFLKLDNLQPKAAPLHKVQHQHRELAGPLSAPTHAAEFYDPDALLQHDDVTPLMFPPHTEELGYFGQFGAANSSGGPGEDAFPGGYLNVTEKVEDAVTHSHSGNSGHNSDIDNYLNLRVDDFDGMQPFEKQQFFSEAQDRKYEQDHTRVEAHFVPVAEGQRENYHEHYSEQFSLPQHRQFGHDQPFEYGREFRDSSRGAGYMPPHHSHGGHGNHEHHEHRRDHSNHESLGNYGHHGHQRNLSNHGHHGHHEPHGEHKGPEPESAREQFSQDPRPPQPYPEFGYGEKHHHHHHHRERSYDHGYEQRDARAHDHTPNPRPKDAAPDSQPEPLALDMEPVGSVGSADGTEREPKKATALAAKRKGVKGVVCSVCDKFIVRDFSRHVRIHDEAGRFQCLFPPGYCKHKLRKFNRPYDYKKHLLNVHFKFDDAGVKLAANLTEKLLERGQCSTCGLRFVASDWLDEHILTTDLTQKCHELQRIETLMKDEPDAEPES